jgi:hypothetical protein
MGWKLRDPIAAPLSRRVEGAILAALDDTTAAAAISAKQNHPTWKNVTGALEGSIRMEPARRVSATRYRGKFGSFDIAYAIYQELGTRFIAAGHFLRNAADAEFPKLGQRLRSHL